MIDVLALLDGLGIQIAKRQGRRIWAKCPNPEHQDHDPSWFIWNDPESHHHARHRCYGCGFRGGALALVRDVLGCDLDAARDALSAGTFNSIYLDVMIEMKSSVSTRIDIPEWVKVPGPGEPWSHLPLKYLTARRLPMDRIRKWGLGWIDKGTLAGRIWIPIRNCERRLISWQARSYVGDDLRYMTPDRCRMSTLFGAEHWPEAEDRRVVVVVEGPFDALAVDRVTNLPVAALIGSNPNDTQMAALSTFDTVVVLTDPDPAGDKAALALHGMARWTQVHRVRLPEGIDPGDVSDARLLEVLGPWLK